MGYDGLTANARGLLGFVGAVEKALLARWKRLYGCGGDHVCLSSYLPSLEWLDALLLACDHVGAV